jgi:hypothetical protein
VLYLVILVAVAAAGLLRLWLQHRRDERNRNADLRSLRASLERLSAPSVHDRAQRADRIHAPASTRPVRGARPRRPPALEPLDPGRREAARRRIEARRAARARPPAG